MQANTTTKKRFHMTKRYWILLLGIVLFLPPLSFLFQFTQDSSFCGSWCPRMFFVWQKGETASAFLSGMTRSFMGVALVLGVLITTFFLGRLWCSHLCPIGATSELGSRLLPKALKVRLDSVPASSVRYGYLAAFFILPAIGLGSLCCSYCNFSTVPRLLGAPFSQADMAYFLRTGGLINLGLVVGLGFMTRGGRGYCNLLCPIGALDALANKLGVKLGRRVRVIEDRCTGCGHCKDVCPVWAIEVDKEAAVIDQLSCFSCKACIKACPRQAIVYGLEKKSEKKQIETIPAYTLTPREDKELVL